MGAWDGRTGRWAWRSLTPPKHLAILDPYHSGVFLKSLNSLISPLILRTTRHITYNMVPSPKFANKKHPFDRFHFLAFFLGCFFVLLLWHRGGRSDDLRFGNELNKNIKVHRRSSDPLFVCIQLNSSSSNSNHPSRLLQFSQAQGA